ncbi:MAG: carbohydrate kinase family protein [Candidatus Paceibacterota bacterium]
MNTQIDFLAIGDIVSEPFIKLQDAQVHCNIDEENCMLSMRFGDKIPYESAEICHAVGNSPNAAVSASRLGVKSYLMSYQGDDQIGKENLESLARDGVRTDYMQIVKGLPSNYHYVLWYDVERTILVKHTEFPYSFPMDIPEPKWIYLSSLASNSTAYHLEIAEYLKQHPSVKLAFQPGTFQMKLGTETLKDIYAHTEVFFCNYEEAQRILKTEEKDKIKLMENLRALGPKIVVMTDGIKGAYAYDGTGAWFMPVYPQEPFERTGAGDAFASTFTTALLLGKTIPEALLWAPINSMSVVLQVGAQKGLLTQAQIEEFLAKAPEDYKPKKIN